MNVFPRSLLPLLAREAFEVQRAAAEALGLVGTVEAVEPLPRVRGSLWRGSGAKGAAHRAGHPGAPAQ